MNQGSVKLKPNWTSWKLDVDGNRKTKWRLQSRLNEIYHKHTGKSVKDIEKALERDNFLKPEDAKAFGLIDHVVDKREAKDK